YEDFAHQFNQLFSDDVLKNERLTKQLVRILTQVIEIDEKLIEAILEIRMRSFIALRPKLEEKTSYAREKRAELHEIFDKYYSLPGLLALEGATFQEIYGYGEVQSFIAECSRRISRDTGTPTAKLPRDILIRYFDKYLDETEAIPGLVREEISEKDLDPIKLFEKIQRSEKSRRMIKSRWLRFLGLYCMATNTELSPECFNLDIGIPKLRALFSANPSIKELFEKSYAIYYQPLMASESRLKTELKKRTEKDPELVKAIIRDLHDHDNDICDESVDWLLGLDSEQVEEVIDVESLRKKFGDEGYTYEGTPYYMLRDLVKALELKEDDVLKDLGSGYGRVAIYTGITSNAKKAVGVEIVPERANRSVEATQVLGLENVEFKSRNARDEDLSDGTVFFFFNPFKKASMETVGEKLKRIATERKIRVVSWGGGLSDDYFNAQKWLKEVKRIGVLIIYESVPPGFAPATIGSDLNKGEEGDGPAYEPDLQRALFDELQKMDLSDTHKEAEILKRAKKVWLKPAKREEGRGSYLTIVTHEGKKYQLLSKVEGATHTYRAVEESSGKKVIVKMATDTGPAVQLLRDYTFLRDLDENEGLVNAYEAGYLGEYYFTVIGELVGKKSLAEIRWMALSFSPSRAHRHLISYQGAINVGKGVLNILEDMHGKGIIHADIKPDHIFVDSKRGKSDFRGPALIDLSIAVKLDAGESEKTIAAIRTPLYMAPEAGLGKYSPSVDLYSLGCVLYKMLTDRHPFEDGSHWEILKKKRRRNPPDIRQFNNRVPKPLALFIMKLIQKNPEDRYISAGEARRALEQAEKDMDLTSRTRIFDIVQDKGKVELVPSSMISRRVDSGKVDVFMKKISIVELKEGEEVSTDTLHDCTGFIARGKRQDGRYLYFLGHLAPENIPGQMEVLTSLIKSLSISKIELLFNSSEYKQEEVLSALMQMRVKLRKVNIETVADPLKSVWRQDKVPAGAGRKGMSIPGFVKVNTKGFVSTELDIDGNESAPIVREWEDLAEMVRHPYENTRLELTQRLREQALADINGKIEGEKVIGKLVQAFMDFAASASTKDKKEKVVIALDNKLGEGDVTRLYQELAKVLPRVRFNNEELLQFLENLFIISDDSENLVKRLRNIKGRDGKEGVKPENIIVVTTSTKMDLYESLGDVTITGIDKSGFPETAYMPLLEIILFALTRYMATKRTDFSEEMLRKYYELIPNVTLIKDLAKADYENIFIKRQVKRFVIRLIPDAVPLGGQIEDLRENLIVALRMA
ncbi:MAG: protein kinase, partial [Candidatus Omnitrophota bacterium]